jgi:hypothetical protein
MKEFFKNLTANKLLYIFICLNLIIGIFTVSDYGISVDELIEARTGEVALYAFRFDWISEPKEMVNREEYYQNYYGPAQTMLFVILEKIVAEMINISWENIYHFGYFLFFQIGIISFYFLAKRFIQDKYALLTTLFFATQPIYWGHAFINPKDIPFMSVFLGTVALGLTAVDKISMEHQKNSSREESLIKKILLIDTVLLLIALFPNALRNILSSIFTTMASISYSTSLAQFFPENYSPSNVGAYADKFSNLFHKGLIIIIITFVIFQILWIVYQRFINKTDSALLYILLAGMVWGFTIATRVIGISAGGIVGIYMIYKLRSKSAMPIYQYLISGIATMVLFWPLVWFKGLAGIIQSLDYLFSLSHRIFILFEGELFSSNGVPRHFLPKLLSFQFTEPALILFVLGLGLFIFHTFSKKLSFEKLLVLAWFFLPALYVVLTNKTMYDNFRQYLFITPPLFIFCGIAIETLFNKINSKRIHYVLMVILLLPSLISNIRLHPFQYVYYNSLAGGFKGAYQRYELDYWGTSSKHAAAYLNEHAGKNDRVGTILVGHILAEYSREDLHFLSLFDMAKRQAGENFDPRDFSRFITQDVLVDARVSYLVLPVRGNLEIGYDQFPTVYEYRLQGIPLMIVKEVP